MNQVTAFFAGADHTITQTTDFTAPTVQSVAFNAPTSTVGQGALVTVTVTMNEAVLVETAFGSPTLGLNDGGVATFDASELDIDRAGVRLHRARRPEHARVGNIVLRCEP